MADRPCYADGSPIPDSEKTLQPGETVEDWDRRFFRHLEGFRPPEEVGQPVPPAIRWETPKDFVQSVFGLIAGLAFLLLLVGFAYWVLSGMPIEGGVP